MALEQLNFNRKTKVEVAIMRLQEFEPPEGYYLAFSGGKDSIVIYDLAVKAGVKFDVHYNRTGIDPPELVYFMRKYYPDLIIEKPKESIWEGIQYHGMPRRQARWCCELLKEGAGSGRKVLTGVRWAESPKRQKRQMVEVCKTDKTKIFVNPIIDWTPTKGQRVHRGEVWDYIHWNNLPYCSLYDEDFRRLGCVLCPMETPRQTKIELVRFPKIAEAWKRACFRYYARGRDSVQRWDSPEAFWQWWISRKGETNNKAQCVMFE